MSAQLVHQLCIANLQDFKLLLDSVMQDIYVLMAPRPQHQWTIQPVTFALLDISVSLEL